MSSSRAGHSIGRIYGGAKSLLSKDVGKDLTSGRGNNKTTAFEPAKGKRETERGLRRLARQQAKSK